MIIEAKMLVLSSILDENVYQTSVISSLINDETHIKLLDIFEKLQDTYGLEKSINFFRKYRGEKPLDF